MASRVYRRRRDLDDAAYGVGPKAPNIEYSATIISVALSIALGILVAAGTPPIRKALPIKRNDYENQAVAAVHNATVLASLHSNYGLVKSDRDQNSDG